MCRYAMADADAIYVVTIETSIINNVKGIENECINLFLKETSLCEN